jgi:hypothetical protein
MKQPQAQENENGKKKGGRWMKLAYAHGGMEAHSFKELCG